MTARIEIAELNVCQSFYQFIEQEVLPETQMTSDKFWNELSNVIVELSPKNLELLETRETLQKQIDQWHQTNKDADFDTYKAFLTEIGYLAPEVDDFNISTENVDPEIATMAGPQLVVPVMNARFALNAVNARWGSLYDALYGSNIISEDDGCEKSGPYNPARGNKVIEYARQRLDQYLPLTAGSHSQATSYQIIDGQLKIALDDNTVATLIQAEQFIGYTGAIEQPSSLIFKQNGLHIEIQFDADKPSAKHDLAGVSDILLEAALTTIMDCEDSVAAVDSADKIIAYRNWLGLIKGTLSENVKKGGETFTRTLAQDKQFTALSGQEQSLKGRSLMFVRNVGHLMTNDAIIDKHGNQVPEGILDAMVTSLIGTIDINKTNKLSNSTEGSIYIVKPKMHGPDEVAFANTLFAKVEQSLGLATNTIKMGIMDEERRTSVNLKACIKAASERVVFINTGFLDRTGDEIHTSMFAGAILPKNEIKNTKWISAYENNNVDIGLACGLSGKAQIGKGMWPVPDDMASMMEAKVGHVQSGANTAWVPSPTAATLHALHYHDIDVFNQQKTLVEREPANVDDILTIPVATETNWSTEQIEKELDNNNQGILGYVVRWIDQGIGCSKVPDINNVGLMEDRATLRISSQHIANWLLHKVCSPEQVIASLEKMARIVDQQNENDPLYQKMADNFSTSIAFQAACQLVFQGVQQPSGYTEPLLHQFRIQKKAS